MPLHLAELKKHTEQNERIIALLEKLVEGRENNEIPGSEVSLLSKRTSRDAAGNAETKNGNVQPHNRKGGKRPGRNAEFSTLG